MAGVSFLMITAFLYATRFISAVFWGSGVSTWNAELYQTMLGYVDQGLTTWSIVGLAIGLTYLLWAEIGNKKL
jgi:hypothetical protein